MSSSDLLGFTSIPVELDSISAAKDPRKPQFILKKMLPEYVWDITQLEDNPMTFLNVQTLLDGTTVGNYRIEDHDQVLNQAKALKELGRIIGKSEFELSKSLAQHLHYFVANEEALTWGKFRDGQVGIGGTTHQPPSFESLNEIYDLEIQIIQQIRSPVEKALNYFLWASMNQFFYDGNKRTARLVMNYILMSNGYYYLSVPSARK